MFDFWETELSEEEADKLIDKAVSEIRRRKLEVPAILAIEMHKPLAYVGANAAVALSPFLVPFLGFDAINDYSRLFLKRDNVERLLARLENRSDKKSDQPVED